MKSRAGCRTCVSSPRVASDVRPAFREKKATEEEKERLTAAVHASIMPTCTICQQDYHLMNCSKLLKMNIEERPSDDGMQNTRKMCKSRLQKHRIVTTYTIRKAIESIKEETSAKRSSTRRHENFSPERLLAEILFTTGIACSSSIKRITYDLVLHRFITLVMCPFCIHTAHTHWRISTLIINRTLFYDTSSSELLWTSFDELELDMTTVTGDDKISEDATLSLSDAAICKIHILFQPGRRFSISDHIYSKCCIPVDRANSNSDRDKTAQQYFAKYSEIWCATVNHNRRLCNQTVSSVTRELLKTQRHRFIPQTF
ncbi:hypothetical protein T4E_11548 [Trichinella pseudospiralis]|uniref:Uncharacterized protein n=1 Tax=Trichinella pseudospiralis TaxID=6337 RepID=A0A0V0XF68_TRIPS|nr:hypothetical protein T4E_9781 [Trichinella pseudospiralis]KRX87328.1 hypothetical protein T4E_11548 [Trichinella pseudospiralis]